MSPHFPFQLRAGGEFPCCLLVAFVVGTGLYRGGLVSEHSQIIESASCAFIFSSIGFSRCPFDNSSIMTACFALTCPEMLKMPFLASY